MIDVTLNNLKDTDLDRPYPEPFLSDNPETIGYYLLQMAVHINYHLGQVNYHRRLIGNDNL